MALKSKQCKFQRLKGSGPPSEIPFSRVLRIRAFNCISCLQLVNKIFRQPLLKALGTALPAAALFPKRKAHRQKILKLNKCQIYADVSF